MISKVGEMKKDEPRVGQMKNNYKRVGQMEMPKVPQFKSQFINK
jgi:hypothetical protein